MTLSRSDRIAGSLIGLFALTLGGVAITRTLLMIPRAFDLGFVAWSVSAVAAEGLDARVPWADLSVLGDHLSIVPVVLAPLSQWFWLPVFLVALQALALASAGALLWNAAQRTLVDRDAGWVTVAALLHPATLYAGLWDVHTNVLGVPFLVLFLVAVSSSNRRAALVWGVLSALMREDLAVIVALVGIANRRRVGTGVTRGLVAVGVVAVALWRSFPSNAGTNSLFGYVDLSDPVGSISEGFGYLVQNGYVVSVLLFLALPWVLFRRMDWRIVLPVVVPHLLLMFSATPVTRSIGFHYYVLIPFAAAIGVISRARAESRDEVTDPSTRRFVAAVTALFLVLGPLGTSAVSREYTSNSLAAIASNWEGRTEEARSMWATLRCVRDLDGDLSVAVDSRYVPWVRDRNLYVLPHPFEDLQFASGTSSVVLRQRIDVQPDLVLLSPGTAPPAGFTRSRSVELVASLSSVDVCG